MAETGSFSVDWHDGDVSYYFLDISWLFKFYVAKKDN